MHAAHGLLRAELHAPAAALPALQTVRLYDADKRMQLGTFQQPAPVLDVVFAAADTAFCTCLDGSVRRQAVQTTVCSVQARQAAGPTERGRS